MNKMILFFVLVLAGVFAIILLLNGKELTANSTLSVSPTIPPLTLNQPIEQTKKQASGTPIVTNVPVETVKQTVKDATQTATIKTSKGDIVLTLFPKDAPNTVKNFITKAKSGFYNNLNFHRVEDWVVQGGDPLGNGTGGGKMNTELNNKPFVIGSLGVARGQDIKVSNDAQFFITKKDASWLNNQYTNFGMVTKGMDVVEKIEIGDKILGITID